MAHEILKIILQTDNVISGKLLLFNILDYTISFNKINKNPYLIIGGMDLKYFLKVVYLLKRLAGPSMPKGLWFALAS